MIEMSDGQLAHRLANDYCVVREGIGVVAGPSRLTVTYSGGSEMEIPRITAFLPDKYAAVGEERVEDTQVAVHSVSVFLALLKGILVERVDASTGEVSHYIRNINGKWYRH